MVRVFHAIDRLIYIMHVCKGNQCFSGCSGYGNGNIFAVYDIQYGIVSGYFGGVVGTGIAVYGYCYVICCLIIDTDVVKSAQCGVKSGGRRFFASGTVARFAVAVVFIAVAVAGGGVACSGGGYGFFYGYVLAYGAFFVPVSGCCFGCGVVGYPVSGGVVCGGCFCAVIGGTFMPVLYCVCCPCCGVGVGVGGGWVGGCGVVREVGAGKNREQRTEMPKNEHGVEPCLLNECGTARAPENAPVCDMGGLALARPAGEGE